LIFYTHSFIVNLTNWRRIILKKRKN